MKQSGTDNPKPIRRILGIDPGSTVVGFACIEIVGARALSPRDFRIVDAGVLRAPAKEEHAVRLGILHNTLFNLATELAPDCCVMERAFSGVNPFTALRLGEARGALISSLCRVGVALEEIAPAHAKKVIAGKGNATKEQVAQVLATIWKFERGALPFDATDALSLALAWALGNGVHRPAPLKPKKKNSESTL